MSSLIMQQPMFQAEVKVESLGGLLLGANVDRVRTKAGLHDLSASTVYQQGHAALPDPARCTVNKGVFCRTTYSLA